MTFFAEIAQTSVIEFIAVAAGLIGVWYSKKLNILVFQIGIVNEVLFAYVFFDKQLYSNMIINLCYLAMSIFGWYHWKHPKKDEKTLPVKFLTIKEVFVATTSCLAIFGIMTIISKHLSGNEMSVWDSFSAACGLLGMMLTALKKVENWIFYLIADIVLIPICITNELYFSGLQYLIYCIICFMAFFSWRKEALKNA